MCPVQWHRLTTPITLLAALIGAWATPMPADAAEQAVQWQFGTEQPPLDLKHSHPPA